MAPRCARNYWESPENYLQDVFDYCSESTGSSLQDFKACYDSSVDGAIDRGYITEDEVAHAPAPR